MSIVGHVHSSQSVCTPTKWVAICSPEFDAGNILLLRGKIQILPPDRSSVSYEFLSQLLGDYLLTSCPEVDIGAALSAMPYTTSEFSPTDQHIMALSASCKLSFRGYGSQSSLHSSNIVPPIGSWWGTRAVRTNGYPARSRLARRPR